MLDKTVHKLHALCREKGVMIALAESCTGGLVASLITREAGASSVLERGYVTYSNAAKQECLGVRAQTLATFGAVSEETARDMAAGALQHSRAQIALSITGIAGPDGGSADKPVGTVCFAVASDSFVRTTTQHFTGERASIQNSAAQYGLSLLLKNL